jgi:hypothetical protein
MSGQPNIYPSDPSKFRQQYISNLQLEIAINDKNFEANKIFKKTGQTPTQLLDTRNTTEKLADLQNLKTDVRSQLSQIADGTNAQQIVEQLNPNQLQFLAQHIDEIIKDIKPKYKYGILSEIFIPYFEAYMQKANLTNEVSFGLQQATGQNLLLGIQQIAELVNPQILDRLRIAISIDTLNISDALRRELQYDIGRLENLIPQQEDLIRIAQIQDANTKATVEKAISDAVSVLPTQVQIMRLITKLEASIKNNDNDNATRICRQLDELLTVEPATASQLESVKRIIQDQGRPPARATTPGRETMTGEEREKASLIELWKNLRATTGDKKSHSFFNLPPGISGLQQATNGQLKAAISSLRRLYDIPEEEPVSPKFESQIRTQQQPPRGRGMKGRGINTTDIQGIKPKNNYLQFGKYYINENKLKDNIICIRRHNGVNVSDIPVRRITNDLGNVIRTISGNGQPHFDDLGKLTTVEKEYLYRISKRSNILDRLTLPTPNKDEKEKDINQFEIYKGELLNGNDSTELIKKFKLLIIKMIHNELLPKGQAKEILMELATLGY